MELRRETAAPPGGNWAIRHLAGLIALGIGGLGLLVVGLVQDPFWATSDWRISTPFLVAATIAAAISLIRREGAWALPLCGVALALATLFLGGFLITAIVVLATVLVIIILHAVM